MGQLDLTFFVASKKVFVLAKTPSRPPWKRAGVFAATDSFTARFQRRSCALVDLARMDGTNTELRVLPPATQRRAKSGKRSSRSRICRRASTPMTL